MMQIRKSTAVLAATAILFSTTMAVVALMRTADAGGVFSDTPPWIADEASWLASNGIASGYPDGTFRPNDDITRGQAALWFANYNRTITTHSTSSDPGLNSEFAQSAVCPPNKHPIAGGGTTDVGAFLQISSSRPVGLDSWQVTWTATDLGTFADPTEIRAYVTCAPNSPPP